MIMMSINNNGSRIPTPTPPPLPPHMYAVQSTDTCLLSSPIGSFLVLCMRSDALQPARKKPWKSLM